MLSEARMFVLTLHIESLRLMFGFYEEQRNWIFFQGKSYILPLRLVSNYQTLIDGAIDNIKPLSASEIIDYRRLFFCQLDHLLKEEVVCES